MSSPTTAAVRTPLTRWLPAIVTVSLGIPAIALRFSGADLSPEVSVLVFGGGILTAAFLLGAASEAAQHDIPAGLSLAVLAFVAVLPEYAVDLVFAWRAGTDPEQAQFAIANMTGGNRLLLGLGWTSVLFLYTLRSHQSVLVLPRTISLDVAVLGTATLIAFFIPLAGDLNMIFSVLLITLFVYYLHRLAQQPQGDPPEGGPAAMVTELPRRRRQIVVGLFFAYAAGVIVASAEPFADGLIELGESLGIDQFLLIQWLAPLASESPEFLAAGYLVWRGLASDGMTMLISSKVNQWTLLLASLPIAFAISGNTLSGLPLDSRQQGEIVLTAAQSCFGLFLILDRRLSRRAAVLLLGLFLGQFLVTDSTVRWGFSAVYLVLSAGILVRDYRLIPGVLRDALRQGAIETTEPSAKTPS